MLEGTDYCSRRNAVGFGEGWAGGDIQGNISSFVSNIFLGFYLIIKRHRAPGSGSDRTSVGYSSCPQSWQGCCSQAG